jgi:diadenosine tetraphosphate (Ap4A) HIT family hydrolase
MNGGTDMSTRGRVEQSLLELWADMLRTDVGLDDDFFGSGGNSMAAVRMLTQVTEAHRADTDIDLDRFFGEPTVRTLAGLLVEGTGGPPPDDDAGVVGCLGCDLMSGRRHLPGGVVHETPSWVVNHAVGSMNLGTLILAPREHVVAVADLPDAAVAEMGPLLRAIARVVESICRPEQTYVCLWSHGDAARRHLHIAVQPVTTELVHRYGGVRSEQLQARILASGEQPADADVEAFCDEARRRFRETA